MSYLLGPMYYYRKRLIFDMLKQTNKRHALEIGFGSGDFTIELAKKGFYGDCVDYSEYAVNALKNKVGNDFLFSILHKPFEKISGKYDFVLAFEVLEHLDNDMLALKKWASLLNDSGILIFSIPAHMNLWGYSDERGGHRIRYEKRDLVEKIEAAGLKIEHFWSYGFPLLNITQRISNYYFRNKIHASDDEKVKTSGVWNAELPLSSLLINDVTMFPFYAMQKLFINKDIGVGYLVCCRRG